MAPRPTYSAPPRKEAPKKVLVKRKRLVSVASDIKPPCMDLSKMTKAEKDEMIVTNAAIMLHDDGLEITAEKLS